MPVVDVEIGCLRKIWTSQSAGMEDSRHTLWYDTEAGWFKANYSHPADPDPSTYIESLSPSAASVCVICVCCLCPAQDTYVLQTNKRGVKCQEEVNLNFRKRSGVKKDSTGLECWLECLSGLWDLVIELGPIGWRCCYLSKVGSECHSPSILVICWIGECH